MKEMSARAPLRFLLAASIILACTCARPRAHSPAAQLTPAAQAAALAEVKSLSRNGPAIPTAFDMRDFKFRALFKQDWSVRILYELSQPGSVTLNVSVDGHDHPEIDWTVRGLVKGYHTLTAHATRACTIPFPGGIAAATYSIKAVTDQRPAPGVAPFFIRGIAVGPLASGAVPGDAVVPPPGDFKSLRGALLTDAAYGFAAPVYQAALPLGIRDLIFEPRMIPLVKGRPSEKAAYSFHVSVPFSHARARVQRRSDTGWVEVSQKAFDERLEVGKIFDGDWNCMAGGAPSLGRHQVGVTAWFTREDGGRFSHLNSEPVVVGH